MSVSTTSTAEETRLGAEGRCPFHPQIPSAQKTAPVVEPTDTPIRLEADGAWHVRGYREARAILRSENTIQAGFKAEEISRIGFVNKPVLFMDGEAHHEQRRRAARFFTPKATHSYRDAMEAYAREVLSALREGGKADLSILSMKMAVQVAAQVVGLTNSRRPGMDLRLSRFFEEREGEGKWRKALRRLQNQFDLAMFFFMDVQPAIQARRAAPQDDVISYLIESGYNSTEILTECIMYGAAGMATTREFIAAAAWHLLEVPERREWYLGSDEATRYAFLHEALRLEPVVGQLHRRATADLLIESDAGETTIPSGSLIVLHTYAINADESITGEAPLQLCPMREMREPRVPPDVMAFSDGPHRCVGAYLAIQESDIFLRQFLALPALRVEREPTMSWNPIAKGYELRDFIVTTVV